MQQIFVETVHDHQVEFSRLLFPVRYKLFIRVENENPAVVVIQKDENGDWYMNADEQTPGWVSNMQDALTEVIKENESKKSLETA